MRARLIRAIGSLPNMTTTKVYLVRHAHADCPEEPASQRPRNSSVPSCRPTQKVGLNPQGSSRYLQARERGRTRQTLFRYRDWVGAQAGVESIARDQGKTPKCTGGVEAPGETGAPKTRLNPVRSQLGGSPAWLRQAARNWVKSKAFSLRKMK